MYSLMHLRVYRYAYYMPQSDDLPRNSLIDAYVKQWANSVVTVSMYHNLPDSISYVYIHVYEF